MIYFEIPLAGRVISSSDNANAYDYIQQQVGAIANLEYGANQTIKVKVPWRALADMKTLQRPLFQALRTGNPVVSVDKRDQMIEHFGTDAYKKEVANWSEINDARERLRPIADEPKEEADTSEIDFDGEATDVTKEIMKANQGVCLARPHNDPDSLNALLKNVQDGDVELLFLEEFSTHMQEDLTDYLSGDEDELPQSLKGRVEELKGSFGMDWEPVLKTARAKGAKIYAIDNEEARDCPPEYGLFEQHRDTQMNAVVYRVMDAALKDPTNKDKKYMAVVGAVHANTHAGGIPGVCQMFGVPAVRVEGTKAKLQKDNKSLRGMPSREEQIYVDLAMTEGLAKLQAGSGKDAIDNLQRELAAEAKRLKNKDALPSFEEQVFVDQYLKAARKASGNDFFMAELKDAALRKARELTEQGTLMPDVDITSLVPSGPTLENEVGDIWIDREDTTKKLDEVVKSIKAIYIKSHGALYGEDEKNFDKKLANVKKGLAEGLKPKLLTTQLSRGGLIKLAEETCKVIDDDPDDLKKAVTGTTDKWLLTEKRKCIHYKMLNEGVVSDLELAEWVVLAAESTAKGDKDYSVNTGKHSELVGDLAKGLAKVPEDEKDSSMAQINLVKKLVAEVQTGGGKDQGIYEKIGRKAVPDHISIDVSSIKKQWLKKLKTL